MPVQSSPSQRIRLFALSLSLMPLLMTHSAQAGSSELEKRWQDFQKNPRAAMEVTPIKRDSKGRVLAPGSSSLFTKKDILSGSYIAKKNAARLSKTGSALVSPICNAKGVCVPDVLQGRAAAQGRVQDFLDLKEFQIKGVRPTASLKEMEANGLMQAGLQETPWSDNYWPISQGILGNRYTSYDFSGRGHDWKSYYDFINGDNKSLKAIYRSGDAQALDELAPSEKYDLLLGDLSDGEDSRVYDHGYLTPAMWQEGENYWRESGQVESWMGICHGWAPAAFMVPRPRQAVQAAAADGKTSVKFYPSDMKGLASYLWAKGNVATNFLGGRCNDKNPKKDPETGRILSEQCFDTNPGNWHVAVINQIGVARRSFVMDATYDYEVWNQPVYKYAYRYFNPQTGQKAASLGEATVGIDAFTNDKFKRFRSRDTVAVVGIEMDLSYVVETMPNHSETDSQNYDAVETVTYMYDLELNSKGQIIGGEWYTNKHPDFLWVPLYQTRAESYGDSQISSNESWNPSQPLPRFWRDIAITTAVRYGQPLAAIVEPLIEAAQGR